MKCLDKIKKLFEVDEEVKNCPLNPFIINYYDKMEPEYYDEAIKDIKYTMRGNRIYINFLKEKIKQNKTCTDFYNTSRFEILLKREILEKEYSNNTSKYVIDYLKYKKRKYNETLKKGENNGEELKPNN